MTFGSGVMAEFLAQTVFDRITYGKNFSLFKGSLGLAGHGSSGFHFF